MCRSTRAVARPNTTCSNGLVGLENNMGTVCCVLGCDPCGGAGCATNNTLGGSNCCAGEISELCSVTNSAPCKFDRESVTLFPLIVDKIWCLATSVEIHLSLLLLFLQELI